MAFEKLFNELYAVVMLKYFWKPYVADFIKEESPDWVSHTLGLGMEVSQALLQQDGEAQKFIELYLGKRREEIPQSAMERYGEALYFYNERLWALRLPEEQDGYVRRAQYRFAKKLEKLNRNYTAYLYNGLYLFLHTDRPQPEEIAELAESMRLGQQQQQRQFRYVFLDCITRLYIADFEHNSCCVDSIEIPEGARRYMQRQTQVLRQASEWERGTVFAEVEAQLEQI